MVFGRLIPREEKFVDFFVQVAGLTVDGARELEILLNNLPDSKKHAQRIKDLEHQADEITHHTVELLHKTFITPFDREDIYRLIGKLDDILDFIDAAAERLYLYDITAVPPEMLALAEVCLKSTYAIKDAMGYLNDLRKPDEMVKICVEVHRLENEADQILRQTIAKLFKQEPDIRQLIKLKEIFELLETVTDRCEDVANIVEGILLEYA